MAARFAARRPTAVWSTISLIVSSIPYYVVALLAWIFFSLKWKIFPDTTLPPRSSTNQRPWFWGLLLPWLVLGLDPVHVVRAVHPRPDGRDAR